MMTQSHDFFRNISKVFAGHEKTHMGITYLAYSKYSFLSIPIEVILLASVLLTQIFMACSLILL